MIDLAPGSVLVSCQARSDNPLHGPVFMAAMARAAEAGGAVAIRADGPADIAAIRAAVDIPVLGINKTGDRAGVYITPTVAAARELVDAGASMVAVDATLRGRPDGTDFASQVRQIHDQLGVVVMADADSLESGIAAAAAGADWIGTTLAGYTSDRPTDGPDIELISQLRAAVDLPIVGEGRFSTPEHVRAAFAAGATAVVVGTAVTNPMAITQALVRAAGARAADSRVPR